MKNLILFLAVIGVVISCKKDKNEEEIISIGSLGDYGMFWDCSYIKSNLFGAGGPSDKDINSKLNEYKPDLFLSFTQASHCTFRVEGFPIGTYRYKFREEKHITFDIDDTNNVKLRATGYIKGGKLFLNFSHLDFQILVEILGDNFPYNKGILTSVNGGEVTLIFTSTK